MTIFHKYSIFSNIIRIKNNQIIITHFHAKTRKHTYNLLTTNMRFYVNYYTDLPIKNNFYLNIRKINIDRYNIVTINTV